RHTRFSRDWSSDVCSSDLRHPLAQEARRARRLGRSAHRARRRLPARGGRARAMSPRAYVLDRLPLLLAFAAAVALLLLVVHLTRSEERRVGKEGRPRRARV